MKTTLFEQFDVNADLETDGVWVTMGRDKKTEKPIAFKLTAITNENKKYQKLMATLGEPYRNVPDLDVEIVEEIAKAGFIGVILVDWDGVEEFRKDVRGPALEAMKVAGEWDGNGDEPFVPMEFSKENAKALLDALPRLYMQLSRIAANPRTFKATDSEDDEKTGKN